MSATAEALLDQLKKLPPEEQEEVSRQLQRLLSTKLQTARDEFPTERLPGGVITSEHVAEVLDDE
jgi:hypothetical protein